MARTLSLALLVIFCSATLAEDPPKGVVVDKDKGTVTVDAKMAPRKLEDPKFKGEQWPLEVLACWGYPKGEKAHETVVTIDDVKPSDVHKGLESLGLKPGKPGRGEAKAEGPEVNVYLEFAGPDDQPKRLPIEKCLSDPASGKPMPKVKWIFTGSAMSKPDPTKDETVYGADLRGTLITIFPVTDETVLQTSLTAKDMKFLRSKMETDPKVLPKVGTAVKLIIEVADKK